MGQDDALSSVLKSVRLTGSVHFCFMPTGDWRVDAPQSMGMDTHTLRFVPFHILVHGHCWLKLHGVPTELAPGDIIAFPRGTAHQLGAGSGGRHLSPLADLPPPPPMGVPLLKYGDAPTQVRMMCGYLECEALDFRPIRDVLPELLMVRTSEDLGAAWLGASIAQIVAEVDGPSAGGRTVLERLTEMMFLELLRREIARHELSAHGWMTAVADSKIGKCLSRIHESPMMDWTIEDLASLAGTSRSVLIERFQRLLGVSPIEYVRDWRLHLASLQLLNSNRSIAEIAYDTGYSSETAFNRAFKRTYGEPPASWRKARS
ncbi:MAG: AraC family transcriptional regulator [Hyphomicrobiaceae bacterium]